MLKQFIIERLQDVEANRLASNVFNEIVFQKKDEISTWLVESGGDLYFNVPKGIHLNSYDKPFKLSIGRKYEKPSYSRVQHGVDVPTISLPVNFRNYADYIQNFMRYLNEKKSSFIHEFIHMLDDLRSGSKILDADAGQQIYQHKNREVNAIFHQIVSKIYDNDISKEIGKFKYKFFLNPKQIKADNEISDMSDGEALKYLLANDVDEACNIHYLVKLFKDELPYYFGPHLPDSIEKNLISRAYTYFKEQNLQMGIDCTQKKKYPIEETYNIIDNVELTEVTFVPSEGSDEKENSYWLDQTKIAIQRGEPLGLHLNIGFPNEIFKLYGNKHAAVLYSDEAKADIVFAIRYETYRDGIRIMNTRSTPSVRGEKLAFRLYVELNKVLNAPIYSDFSQSPFSRYGIWEKLYSQFPNNVRVYDVNSSNSFDIDMVPNKSGKLEMAYNDNGKIKPVYSKKDNGVLLKFGEKGGVGTVSESKIVEAAKRSESLPEDTGLFVKPLNNGYELVLFSPSAKKVFGMIGARNLGTSDFFVSYVAAIDGFGPYLYELTMMYLSRKEDAGLMPDRTGFVKEKAWNIWKKFYERSDVQKSPASKINRSDKNKFQEEGDDEIYNTVFYMEPDGSFRKLTSTAKELSKKINVDKLFEMADKLFNKLYKF
jgi:hypothetical protein